MKVDQYRIQKAKEYSFLVPAGMDLGDFDDPEKGYLEAYQPFALERQDVELETIVEGAELVKVIDVLQNARLAAILSIPISDSNDDGIE